MQIIKISKKGLRKLTTCGILPKLHEKGLKVKIDVENMLLEYYSEDPYIELKGRDILTVFCLSEGSVDIRRLLGLFSEDTYLKIIDLSLKISLL